MADESCVFPGDAGDPPRDAEGPPRSPGQWLDPATAERLLSGASLDTALADHAALDARTAAEAARLDRVLRALRALATDGTTAPVRAERTLAGRHAATAHLPGEAAALAAFRQARDARRRLLPAPKNGHCPAQGGTPQDRAAMELGTVLLTGDTGAPQRPADDDARAGHRRWRPVRLALVATVAACMLGGVALAAGVLPPSLGGTHRPDPTVSVSDAGQPQGLVSGTPTPSGSDTAHPPGGRPRPDASGHAPSHGGNRPGRKASEGEHGLGGATDATQGNDDWWQHMMSVCQDYRGGKRVDARGQRDLEEAAHGPQHVSRFCDSLLQDQKANPTQPAESSGPGDPGDDRNSNGQPPGDPSPTSPEPSPSPTVAHPTAPYIDPPPSSSPSPDANASTTPESSLESTPESTPSVTNSGS